MNRVISSGSADALDTFRQIIERHGMTPPATIEPGRFHRFPGQDKGGRNRAGWCKLYSDGLGGVFGDKASGLSESWQAQNTRQQSPADREAWRKQVAASQARAKAETDAAQQAAQQRAARIWAASKPADASHPYLTTKAVQPHGVRIYRGALVIPLYVDGVLHSLQFIGATDKRFLKDGRTAGCYYPIGRPDGVLCVVEGFATGTTINEATGYAVAVAFNAGNLEAVARAMRAKFPDLILIICADDDYKTDGNPGLTKATTAAQAVGGLLALPVFGADRPAKATDFNDMAALYGLAAVKQAIAGVMNAGDAMTPAADTCPPADTAGESDAAIIASLASMTALEYDRCRVEKAKALGIRPATLDALVKAERAGEDAPQTPFTEPEPWYEAVDIAALLSDVSVTIRRFIVLEPQQADAAALWIAFTWFADVVEVAPLAIINAPEKACGKSQLLTVFGRLVCRPLPAANSSAAFLFRAVELWTPTVLIDEADTFIRDNEELKGLVNAGHTRQNAFVGRVVGDNHEPKLFTVWGAKAMAGIALEKHLPDATLSRAVIFNLRRKLAGEVVERLRHADADLFDTLTAKLARFALDHADAVKLARPVMPEQLNDRTQDNWEPLLAIAGCAGGDWLARATRAALHLSGATESSQSAGNELLSDIQQVFESKRVDRISMADLVAALIEDDEAAWAAWNRGKPLTPRQLGRMLNGYGVKSKMLRIGHDVSKGFEKEQFTDAFTRYLSPPPENGVFTVTQLQANTGAAFSVTEPLVTESESYTKVTPKPAWIKDCNRVTEESAFLGGAAHIPVTPMANIKILADGTKVEVF